MERGEQPQGVGRNSNADTEDFHEADLALSLAPPFQRPRRLSIDINSPANDVEEENPPPSSPLSARTSTSTSTSTSRTRRNPSQNLRPGKSEFIDPPYPWSTNRRAVVHSIDQLYSKSIHSVHGEVQCNNCGNLDNLSYDIHEKFVEIANDVVLRQREMSNRAPPHWLNPTLGTCGACEKRNCMRPVLAIKKRDINWLFLLLGRMLGCCNLQHLRYFCRHNRVHRTGSKDRVLYQTYIILCQQLDPIAL